MITHPEVNDRQRRGKEKEVVFCMKLLKIEVNRQMKVVPGLNISKSVTLTRSIISTKSLREVQAHT